MKVHIEKMKKDRTQAIYSPVNLNGVFHVKRDMEPLPHGDYELVPTKLGVKTQPTSKSNAEILEMFERLEEMCDGDSDQIVAMYRRNLRTILADKDAELKKAVESFREMIWSRAACNCTH